MTILFSVEIFSKYLRQFSKLKILRNLLTQNKTFENTATLQKHKNLHDKNLSRCYFCQWGAAVGETLLISTHLDLHFDNANFKCSACGQRFFRKRALTDHFEIFHEVVPGKYNCKYSDFLSHSRLALGHHLMNKHK